MYQKVQVENGEFTVLQAEDPVFAEAPGLEDLDDFVEVEGATELAKEKAMKHLEDFYKKKNIIKPVNQKKPFNTFLGKNFHDHEGDVRLLLRYLDKEGTN